MKKISSRSTKLTTTLIAVVLVFCVAGFSLMRASFAASGSLSLSPSSGSYNVGDSFNVDLVENGSAATTIQAVVQFPSTLQFVSDTTVAPFSFNPSGTDTASGGSLTITRSYLGGSGSGTVSTLTFKVLSAGSATVSFAASPSSYILPSGCTQTSCSTLTSSPSSTYTLSQPVAATPPSNNPAPSSGPAPTPAAAPTSNNSGGTSVKITTTSGTSTNVGNSTSGQSSSVTAPNNSSVVVNTPVTVQPATVQTDDVAKVEYFLGNKLVDTETKAPYKYNIDTNKLKNGTYALVSKTIYKDGIIKQASQNLVVKNAASNTSGLTWVLILVLGIIVLFGLGINILGPGPFGGNPLRRLFNHPDIPPAGMGDNSTGLPTTPIASPVIAPTPSPEGAPPANVTQLPRDVATPLNSHQPQKPGAIYHPQ